MKIIVDADACPVVDIIIEEAWKKSISVILVRSYNHFSAKKYENNVEIIYVDSGADSADYRILKIARSADLIITQDYGLASLALSKGCRVFHHKGFTYTSQNIDQLLTVRHVHAKARKSGSKTKGPKALTKEDIAKFRKLLRNELSSGE